MQRLGKNKLQSKTVKNKDIDQETLNELKEAFKKLITSVGINQDEVKYEGQRRSKMRWGTGRLFYRNGMMYQG